MLAFTAGQCRFDEIVPLVAAPSPASTKATPPRSTACSPRTRGRAGSCVRAPRERWRRDDPVPHLRRRLHPRARLRDHRPRVRTFRGRQAFGHQGRGIRDRLRSEALLAADRRDPLRDPRDPRRRFRADGWDARAHRRKRRRSTQLLPRVASPAVCDRVGGHRRELHLRRPDLRDRRHATDPVHLRTARSRGGGGADVRRHHPRDQRSRDPPGQPGSRHDRPAQRDDRKSGTPADGGLPCLGRQHSHDHADANADDLQHRRQPIDDRGRQAPCRRPRGDVDQRRPGRQPATRRRCWAAARRSRSAATSRTTTARRRSTSPTSRFRDHGWLRDQQRDPGRLDHGVVQASTESPPAAIATGSARSGFVWGEVTGSMASSCIHPRAGSTDRRASPAP